MTDRVSIPSARHVRIVHLNGPTFQALATGDLPATNAVSPVPVTACFTALEQRRLWRMRSRQVELDPSSADWITGVVWDEQRQLAVGWAGYHGPRHGRRLKSRCTRISSSSSLTRVDAGACHRPALHRARP
ncbi:hypothetical protein [Saccharopolyspora sp. ASAGF58]|uniref:hypothetical protein n=1 Tax=Saccharopolyspora sp. ASAGF58 TaxID=2719023 RepID=UPI00143FE5C6|nr:hypothetical protein [Saccharopolyspora sp. ASAGF58]QIZ36723.1 hypothetical protein FDZ84_21300 [Saccharopolyspora sp. ASAGF58]